MWDSAEYELSLEAIRGIPFNSYHHKIVTFEATVVRVPQAGEVDRMGCELFHFATSECAVGEALAVWFFMENFTREYGSDVPVLGDTCEVSRVMKSDQALEEAAVQYCVTHLGTGLIVLADEDVEGEMWGLTDEFQHQAAALLEWRFPGPHCLRNMFVVLEVPCW